MEKDKLDKAIKRLSVFSAIAGALTILGFVFVLMMGVFIMGGHFPIGVRIFALALIGVISFVFFGSSRRLRRNIDHHEKLKLPTIFLLVASIIAVMPIITSIFGFHPRAALVIGPMSNLGYLFAIVMIVDCVRILRGIKKHSAEQK